MRAKREKVYGSFYFFIIFLFVFVFFCFFFNHRLDRFSACKQRASTKDVLKCFLHRCVSEKSRDKSKSSICLTPAKIQCFVWPTKTPAPASSAAPQTCGKPGRRDDKLCEWPDDALAAQTMTPVSVSSTAATATPTQTPTTVDVARPLPPPFDGVVVSSRSNCASFAAPTS